MTMISLWKTSAFRILILCMFDCFPGYVSSQMIKSIFHVFFLDNKDPLTDFPGDAPNMCDNYVLIGVKMTKSNTKTA